jgi:hypothetical protein
MPIRLPLLAVLVVLIATVSASAARMQITSDTTFYVRQNGSNDNTGLTNDANGAWADPQYALDYVLDNLDFSHFDVRIVISEGAWAPPATGYICAGPHVGRGRLIIEGAGVDLTAIDGRASGGGGFLISNGCTIVIQHMTISAGQTRNCMQVLEHARVQFADIRWEQAKNAHLFVSIEALVEQIGPDRIAGSATNHVIASHGGHFRNSSQITKFEADATFAAYAYASSFGDITYTEISPEQRPAILTNNFKVEGRRCLAELNGLVQAASLGPYFFPGTFDCYSTSGGRVQQ